MKGIKLMHAIFINYARSAIKFIKNNRTSIYVEKYFVKLVKSIIILSVHAT